MCIGFNIECTPDCFAETSPSDERIQAELGAGRSHVRLHPIVNFTDTSVDIVVDCLAVEALRSSS